MSRCPHCQATEDQTTYGRTMRGSQRFKCRHCARVYTPEPLPLGYGDDIKREALRLYLEGSSYEEMAEDLGCDTKTIDNALQRVKRKVLHHQQRRQVLD